MAPSSRPSRRTGSSMERRTVRHFDYGLLLLATALVAYGGLLIYSASLTAYPDGIAGLDHPLAKQVLFAVLGLAVMAAIAWADYRVFGQMAPALYALSIVTLVAVLFMGESAFGSRRWITIAGTQVQASEVAKILTIVALARYLADRQLQITRVRTFLTSLALAVLPAALVMAEPDMGTAVIFGAIWVGMVLVAGARPQHVLMLGGFLLAAIPFAALAVLGEYQRDRIALFFNPNSDPLGGGFNILQAEISVGSGGVFGKGLTEGSQTQLDFLQTPTTDYIFSVLGEELGLIGAVVLLTLFAALLFRTLRVASMARDQFGRLLATGIAIMVLFQVFINIAVNIRLLPVTGIPLPFISQGGSSLIMLFAALGLLQSVLLRHRQIEF
ncbi:MAG: rod shape-determining protein RodA, partial [Dehalococcoidia bacterium]|nr:rod shape-determining protein RodA [Dehalococcoidia bacterium]